MKNRIIAILAETAGLNLIALFFIWKLYMVPGLDREGVSRSLVENGMFIFIGIYIIIMAAIGIQAYWYIVKPYQEHLEELRRTAEENRRNEQIRREFVANVSHELKTPLTSISGFIETLQAGAAEDPEIRSRFIDIIAIETSRLKRLIEDLLVLSDIENRKEYETTEFDVGTALQRTTDILRPIADDKDIEMILDLDSHMRLTGSVDRFRQMMLNLIENAIKYSDRDSRIWVSAEKSGTNILVSIRDEGIGIDEEHHERLFERFYRVDKSRSKKVGGTGLGLSIVKHIAVLFGAALDVESEVGKGTTFYVTFSTIGEDLQGKE